MYGTIDLATIVQRRAALAAELCLIDIIVTVRGAGQTAIRIERASDLKQAIRDSAPALAIYRRRRTSHSCQHTRLRDFRWRSDLLRRADHPTAVRARPRYQT